jgi:hypothetical protein
MCTSARGLARDLKVSLHAEFWYFGFTDYYVERGGKLVPPGEDRKRHVFPRPPEFAPGWTHAFVILRPGLRGRCSAGALQGQRSRLVPDAARG